MSQAGISNFQQEEFIDMLPVHQICCWIFAVNRLFVFDLIQGTYKGSKTKTQKTIWGAEEDWENQSGAQKEDSTRIPGFWRE